jgi:hypothetical protein
MSNHKHTGQLLVNTTDTETQEKTNSDFFPLHKAVMSNYLNAQGNLAKIYRGTYEVLAEHLMGFEEEFIVSWLGSLAAMAWTAIETLCGDLWRASVNSHPAVLAELTGKSNRIERLSDRSLPGYDDDDDISKDKDKSIKLKYIHDYTHGTYEIRHKMGDLLATRFRFTSLKNIRIAYSSAFSDRGKGATTADIDAALVDISLDKLSIVRNLIVHSAGRCDVVYRESQNTIAALPKLEIGEPLLLDGEFLRNMLDNAIISSWKLVRAVDSWIATTAAK